MNAGHGHVPRKRFGQNFLTDPMVIERIVGAIGPAPGDVIVEIGPGQAALTGPLVESGAGLHLVEIDRDLANQLARRYAGHPNLSIHQGDVLELDFSELTGGRPFRLVGNLPYNISTPLLFHVLQWSGLLRDMHVMLQKEVVDRIAAAPGSRNRGRLSVMCQYHFAVTPLFTVPPEAFRPMPRVQSAVVRLVPHQQPPVEVGSLDMLDRVVSQAFSMRRKTLRNSLRKLLGAERIEAAGIDPGLRPEALGLEAFAALARELEVRDKTGTIP